MQWLVGVYGYFTATQSPLNNHFEWYAERSPVEFLLVSKSEKRWIETQESKLWGLSLIRRLWGLLHNILLRCYCRHIRSSVIIPCSTKSALVISAVRDCLPPCDKASKTNIDEVLLIKKCCAYEPKPISSRHGTKYPVMRSSVRPPSAFLALIPAIF